MSSEPVFYGIDPDASGSYPSRWPMPADFSTDARTEVQTWGNAIAELAAADYHHRRDAPGGKHNSRS